MVTLLLTALLCAPPPLLTYPATLERVVDADTYVLRVELGFDVLARVSIRLADLDTPERFTPEGRRASAAAGELLRSGSITVAPTGDRTFARWVAHVCVGGKRLADLLVERGHRKKAKVPK